MTTRRQPFVVSVINNNKARDKDDGNERIVWRVTNSVIYSRTIQTADKSLFMTSRYVVAGRLNRVKLRPKAYTRIGRILTDGNIFIKKKYSSPPPNTRAQFERRTDLRVELRGIFAFGNDAENFRGLTR